MSSLLSFVGWAVLPNYVTSLLQNVYYGITIRAGEPRPQPPSPRYARHRRRIFILVVTSYLLYTLYETFHQVQVTGDFYRTLGVSPLADERTIKSRFRRLAAQHHPDKRGYGDGGPSDDYFVYLKLAQDTLLDPAKRFAYDRFGPDMLSWGDRKTMQDFLFAGLQRSVPQYVVGFLIIIVLNFTYWSNWGRYWRFFTFAALITLEAALITRPKALFMPGFYIPPAIRSLLGISPTFYLLPFQILTLAQRASVTLHIFISQLTPPEVSKGSSSAPGERIHPQTMQRLAQLTQLSRATDGEATRLLQLGLAPFRGDREGAATLRKGMKEGLVLSSVRASPEVQQAIAQVVERKKPEKNGKAD
ncbi:J domain-containing protein [Aspergillus novofumigatus IBT 16806]|uniref:Putative membrane associated DnaJ chaperone n=1 Tax=Aspergillus novofumigatus (strain IBT 16806) TaxID=1392255 RepID=A0A2I1BY61_ASPN1|nr:putative membrane associated DnaJ chaperone [Aspergillus novofumigatus IBT 16806]PKX90313.1 putative membrane associated DnaJ chaperone [Aspergillus novofumigatus IBT 16806]